MTNDTQEVTSIGHYLEKVETLSRRERIEQKVRYLRLAMELRQLRRKVKYSQEKLARKMKVKREFISRIESGTQNITLETLYRVGEAMGKELHFAFK